ncbi:UNVERIFIED_CONTAM: hypothetical protein HDU68_006350 [Siphonaria sp. JEL0065]|nr:hypothetical protein HDU68_006350 [Siphonaria sp. JEL0065]
MDYMVQWCLVCERKLEHQGLYCSPKCLKQDFVLTPLQIGSDLKGQKGSCVGANKARARSSSFSSFNNGNSLSCGGNGGRDRRGSAAQNHVLNICDESPSSQGIISVGSAASTHGGGNRFLALCTPHSFHGHSSLMLRQQHTVSLQSNLSASQKNQHVVFVDLHEFQQSILAPEFSLEFHTRPRMQPLPSSLSATSGLKVTPGSSMPLDSEGGLRAALRRQRSVGTMDQ